MRATTASAALQADLDQITKELGEYPHAALMAGEGGADAPKKQGTRLLKVECPGCGYVVRTTAKWLTVGVPTCPCGEEMKADETEGGDAR